MDTLLLFVTIFSVKQGQVLLLNFNENVYFTTQVKNDNN